jgi:hypothetical protein
MVGIPFTPRVKMWTWVPGVLREQTWFRSSISIRLELEPEVPRRHPRLPSFQLPDATGVPSEETLLRSG